MWYKLKRILIYPDGVTEKQVYPKYEWKPDASRTLLYLPLESNTNDYSGNSRTTSATSVTFTTVGWVQSAHVWTSWWIIVTPNGFINHSTPYMTTSALVYVTSQTTSARRNVFEWAIQNTLYFATKLVENSSNIQVDWGNSNVASNSIIPNSWMHIVHTCWTPWTWYSKMYINWVLVGTASMASDAYPRWNRPNSYQQSQTVLNWRGWVSASQWLNWNAREIIFENIEWSDEDVSKYYQRIKNKLWI